MKKKLSLEEFKGKANKNKDVHKLSMISGGILGACHTVTVSYNSVPGDNIYWKVTYGVYYM